MWTRALLGLTLAATGLGVLVAVAAVLVTFYISLSEPVLVVLVAGIAT
jgi:hypothetical protein